MKYGYQRTIKLCWHCNYYDGPISGVCEIEGSKYWFDQIRGPQGEIWIKHTDESFDISDEDSYDYDITRIYRVFRLPEDIMKKVIFNHELFRKYVGHHTDYVDNMRNLGCHPDFQANWNRYTLESLRDFNLNEHTLDSNCIGWFDSNSRSYYKEEK
jgi:hypothetical protein